MYLAEPGTEGYHRSLPVYVLSMRIGEYVGTSHYLHVAKARTMTMRPSAHVSCHEDTKAGARNNE
jgi:hypothetical protein